MSEVVAPPQWSGGERSYLELKDEWQRRRLNPAEDYKRCDSVVPFTTALHQHPLQRWASESHQTYAAFLLVLAAWWVTETEKLESGGWSAAASDSFFGKTSHIYIYAYLVHLELNQMCDCMRWLGASRRNFVLLAYQKIKSENKKNPYYCIIIII